MSAHEPLVVLVGTGWRAVCKRCATIWTPADEDVPPEVLAAVAQAKAMADRAGPEL